MSFAAQEASWPNKAVALGKLIEKGFDNLKVMPVLSFYKDKSLRLLKSHWRTGIKILQSLIKDPQACY